MIDINKTELSESNYSEFMDTLDAEFLKQYPESFDMGYKHSETISREEWFLDYHGGTVQDIINDEVSHWEAD